MSEDTKLRMKMERELELRRSNLDELKSRLNEQDAERHESQNERSKQTSPKVMIRRKEYCLCYCCLDQ
ncbi:hypothetical protein B0I72DRAFT_139431 [Yarrowia lipolytica]|uniref:Uncharacterized protein n=1 Tax=Yarrowia lipolytica TaxID=4952 RepID=A0A371BYA5_YARLL|nr:hypothetical protein BKA91DRAFT_137522 [Yarrowia lipolytica]KAE8170973.1 hypothetical protein BKA90DRAFT_139956 [Yarrowia lipolytica]QNP95142.1 Hypothetical protein YALI2_A00141g [Yarrowia lipolytica]RDW23024.1 hypothetical protein B0I71DRAFT_136630 [Yarrowia lipolytica]RDW31683.1 hypothetical protein B0I72DRAFT_139431 [Yarrowia lipolytica]